MILDRAIGIDLGTTNSAAAMLDVDERSLLLCEDAQRRTTVSSCVWWDPRAKNVIVGHRAYARIGSRPEPIWSIKRSMGTQMTVDLGGTQQTPPEISSHILSELKSQMSAYLEKAVDGRRFDVGRAIVTVPAYFGLPAIEATRQAAELAGLEVVELLHEPTAAAIYYAWKYDLGDGLYLVYDFGGGTFDASVLRRTSGEFLVLGISGDNFLGGDDFDRRLAEHLRGLLVDDDYDLQLDVPNDPEDRLRFHQLVNLAERAKKKLSSSQEIVLKDQGTLRDKSGEPVIVDMPIERATFEQLIDDPLERTIECCREAIKLAGEKGGVALADVDHILLVGGSTHVPAVMERVRQAFCSDQGDAGSCAACQHPIRDDPDTAVALGAALRAATAPLGMTDDKSRIRVWFRGSSATRRQHTTVGGHVEPLQNGLTLEGASLRLANVAGDVLGEVELDDRLRFSFPRIDLQQDTLNEFLLELTDATGQAVASVGRSVVQSADQKQSVGRALSTSVLSKPIVLEATHGDRLIRQTLLAEGTSLPATASFTFSIADASGQVRLPIYQGNRIIKELWGDVGAVQVGTPVDVEITCDELVHINVRFTVAGQAFGGSIEPPPPDAVPTDYDIRRIERQFLERLSLLDRRDAQRFIADFQRTHRELQEAREGADYPKLVQRAADLEAVVREARLAEPPRPPLDETEHRLKQCTALLHTAEQIDADMAASLQSDLTSARERAREAYERRDHEAYSDAIEVIDTALRFLVGAARTELVGDEVDESIQAQMAMEEARQMLQLLLVACMVGGRGDLVVSVHKYLQELEQLTVRLDREPHAVLNRCQIMMTEAKRTYQQIKPEDRLSRERAGLLDVDAQSYTRQTEIPKDLFSD